MKLFEPLFQALNEGEIRYVVVGGLAVVLHGYARFTADLDLIIDLDPKEAERALEILQQAGFEPRIPVAAKAFADPEIRQSWIRDKGMQVFSLWDPTNPLRVVDLFAESPMDFEDLLDRSVPIQLGTTSVRIAALGDLIQMKLEAGRPKDLADVEKLQEIQNIKGDAS